MTHYLSLDTGNQVDHGPLDAHRPCVPADAIEEAGVDADVVEYLRGPAPHVRGCWAVDLIPGKE